MTKSTVTERETKIERRTLNLWPDVGRQLGLGINGTYLAAARGEIPGAFRIGKRWLVKREVFDRVMGGGQAV